MTINKNKAIPEIPVYSSYPSSNISMTKNINIKFGQSILESIIDDILKQFDETICIKLVHSRPNKIEFLTNSQLCVIASILKLPNHKFIPLNKLTLVFSYNMVDVIIYYSSVRAYPFAELYFNTDAETYAQYKRKLRANQPSLLLNRFGVFDAKTKKHIKHISVIDIKNV
jgi:hypothetical protein